jgi:hypothetical protein
VPSVVAWRGTTSDKPVQSQMSEPVQDTKLESTEESTMTTSKSKVVPGLHKDHKPREEDNILVGYNNFKKLTTEKIEVGLPIARKSITSCGEVTSICVVVSVVRNDQLPGGGMVKMETVWFSSGYEGVNKRRVHSSATFRSLCTSRVNYRVYPFNIEQPLPTPEPEPVKAPEPVEIATTDLSDYNLTIAPELQGIAQRVAERVQLTQEQWAETMVIERQRFRMEQKDREEFAAQKKVDEARKDWFGKNAEENTETNKDNNRLLTEILATLKELKDKW